MSLSYYFSNPSTQIQPVYQYGAHDRDGVICIVVTGLVSLAAVAYLFIVKTPKPRTYRGTHLFGYLLSLFLANAVQSIGTVTSLKWILRHEVVAGTFCGFQGAIKQIGNVGTATWSLLLSMYLFNLLFMRSASTRVTFWATIIIGWSFIATVVIIGPAVLQKADRGPYFSISGPWCWIADNYPTEQVFLEYFLEFLSAGLTIILYTVIILRVRGNLVRTEEGTWQLQFVPGWASWRLAVGRDLLDTLMLKFAQNMVWFPIFYTIILIPVTIARFSSIAGNSVSFGVVVFADVIFNLTGLVNVTLLLSTRRFYPDMDEVPLPEFNTQRVPAKQPGKDSMMEIGVTPFVLTRSDSAESYSRERERVLRDHAEHRAVRTTLTHSQDSARANHESEENATDEHSLMRRNSIAIL